MRLSAGIPLAVLVMGIPGYRQQRRRSAALRWICRWLLSALDVQVVVTGEPRSGPSLVVANHTSWLDVMVLCANTSMVPVAKSEVADWPLVGPVAARSGAVFLRRQRLRDLQPCIDQMSVLLRQGHRVQVFPEATTRCGLAVGEFYRASFQAALDAAVVVQPAALRTFSDGTPTTAAAFVGDDTLYAALTRLLRMPPITVELRWLPPIPAIAGTGKAAVDRATVARLCQDAIARSLGHPVVLRRAVRRHRVVRAGAVLPVVHLSATGN